jgi:hypothetical protein
MKISALYFLKYPNETRMPEDPLVASTEVRVEVGEGNPTHEAFDYTYEFQVHTIGFLQKELLENKKRYIINRSTIIVPRFDVKLIQEAIESILNKIERFGERVD